MVSSGAEQPLTFGIAEELPAALVLYPKVMEHRGLFFAYGWVDHPNLSPRGLQLAPPANTLADWASDFERMRSMFFETPPAPSFDEIIASLREIERALA